MGTKIQYPFYISRATIFYLLIDKANYTMQLFKFKDHSMRVFGDGIGDGIRFHHGFRIDKPAYSNRHCFIHLQEKIA